MTDHSHDIPDAIRKIRLQLAVNARYFSGSDRITLGLLQSHIEEQLGEIERLLQPAE
jgi:hypothetical protein